MLHRAIVAGRLAATKAGLASPSPPCRRRHFNVFVFRAASLRRTVRVAGRVRLWKEVKAKNRRSGRKMSDAIFITKKATGALTIGDKKEIDKAVWRKPRGSQPDL
jgi:hypothetical protein